LLRSAPALLVLCLAVGVAAPASATSGARDAGESATSTGHRGAVSDPVEDSYYPEQGDPGVDTLHYGLRLTWHADKRVLQGRAAVTFRATTSAKAFQLDLGDPLRVRRITLAPARLPDAAVRVPFTHRGTTLRVTAPVVRDQRYRLVVGYRGTPDTVKAPTSRTDFHGLGWHTRKDGQVWTMQEPFGAYTWYPVNDQPSDKAYYDLRVDVPGKWVGVSNGELVKRRSRDGRTITRFHNHAPMSSYLMTLAIGPYQRHRQTGPHGLPMSYWLPEGSPRLLRPLRHTPDVMRWLEQRLGRYPFDRVGIVVTPSESAMETQTMVTFGKGNYDYGRRTVRRTVVHELAHQWYGDTVTPRDWRDVWMNEGMATYLEARWAADQGWTTWRHARHEWRRDDGLWREIYGPPGAYHRNRFAAINVYYCPALMLARLRGKVGADEFDRLVRRWPQTHLNANASRHTFVRWWERRTGKELSRFFHRWLMSPDSPA
jgi:aminopeptidase N